MFTDDPQPIVELRTENGRPETVRVFVYTSAGKCVGDSGEIPYIDPFLTLPAELEAKREYRVRVTARGNGAQATYGLVVDTGFMNGPWEGGWIEPAQQAAQPEEKMAFWQNFIHRPEVPSGEDGTRLRPGQTLRRRFLLEEMPVQAVLYATARGVYTPYLNGQRVGRARLAPEITPYEKLLYYQRYDLLALLRQGENELQIELGDGWYVGRIGLSGSSCQYGERLSFLGQIELCFQDGRTVVIGSDERFESRESKIAYSDLFIGEKWNLCQAEKPWASCIAVAAPEAKLEAQPLPAVIAGDPIEGQWLAQPDGGLLADFGQNLAGVVRLHIHVPKAATVTLEHTETLDAHGGFFRNIVGRNKQQRDQLVCGPGETVFEPLHTYHGFRYVRIRGVDKAQVRSIKAVPIGTPLRQTGHFCCSDDRLNRLQENIQWSMRSNFVSIPTDCPQREKMGWTGDVLAFAATGCFNAELEPILEPWLQQMRLEQRENGEIPCIVPAFPIDDAMARAFWGDNTSSVWGDACILVPLQLYRATGDIRILQDNLPMMERWLDYVRCAAQTQENPLLWTTGHHFGDWLIPSMAGDSKRVNEGVARTKDVVASTFRAVALDSWLQVLDVLSAHGGTQGEDEKRHTGRELLARIRQAVRDAYVSADGHVQGELQGLYVLVLQSGAVEGELRDKVADHLVQMIRENGNRLDTGFVSTPYLLDVLTQTGHKDLAWTLLFQTQAPSWLGQVERGATTIWENWTAVGADGTPTDSSMNHYALGAVGDWIYRHIGGISSLAPGWQKVSFAPDFTCGLQWSECEKVIAAGRVYCRWERAGNQVKVWLETPVEAQWWHEGKMQELQAGKYVFAISV